MTDFTRMFHPRGIAIIGATTDPTRPGRQALDALARHHYAGRVYPVNPKYPDIDGLKCYPSVAAIDGPCDVAVIAVPAAAVPDMVDQCAAKGIGFAAVLGGGFRETGEEGVELERRMKAAAKRGNVRLVGPNCLGYVNVHDNVYAGFGSITKPPDHEHGGVSAVIQSGGFGNSIINQASDVGVGFRFIVASGNESDLTAADVIQAFVDDPKTRVILTYLEGVSDGRALMTAARNALKARKPLVVLKAGNSEQGRRAAASHTASMTGTYDIYRAAFRQCGVTEVRDVTDAVDTLLALTGQRLPKSRNVAVMSGSGGSLVSFSDAADEFGLKLVPLSEATTQVLRDNLPKMASIENPIDYTAGFNKVANAPKYHRMVTALLADPAIDQLGIFVASAAGETFKAIAEAIVTAPNPDGKPIFTFSALPREMTVEGRKVLKSNDIPVLPSPRRLAACMSVVANYADALQRAAAEDAGIGAGPAGGAVLPSGAATLDEHMSKQLLSDFGVPVTRDVVLPTNGPYTLPAGMRYPLVVKIVAPDIPHKSDIGAVKLNIADDAALDRAAAAVVANARQAKPDAAITGVLVSEMIPDGIEVIVGVLNDPLFGPVVAFGMGGVLAEVLHDTTYRIAPFGVRTAREMIGELRAARIFEGVRGQPPRDTEALAQVLVTVSNLAWTLRDRVAEIDINPVMVRPAGQGVVAADALVVTKA